MNKKFLVYIQGSWEIEAKDDKEAFDLFVKEAEEKKYPIDSWKLADKVSGFVIRES